MGEGGGKGGGAAAAAGAVGPRGGPQWVCLAGQRDCLPGQTAAGEVVCPVRQSLSGYIKYSKISKISTIFDDNYPVLLQITSSIRSDAQNQLKVELYRVKMTLPLLKELFNSGKVIVVIENL